MKSLDWIQELYIKDLMEKTHDKYKQPAPKVKGNTKGDRKLSKKVQAQGPTDKI